MSLESAKEAAKVVVETSGVFSSIWEWIISAIGIGVAGAWGHITGRLKKIEETAITAALLKDHIDEENDKFKELFTKHDGLIDKVSAIAASVARIEGKLERD